MKNTSKFIPILGSLLIIQAFVLFAIKVPQKVFAAPPKCFVNSLVGSAVGNCPTSVPGYAGGFVDAEPPKCYEVLFGTTTSVTEKSCDQPPFATNFMSVRCKDGTIQSGVNKTSKELCQNNGGLPDETITCLDGTKKTVPYGSDDATKIKACEANCGYNVPNGDKCNPDKGGTTQLTGVNQPVQRESCNSPESCARNIRIIKYLNAGINFLSALVAVVVVIVIIIGGIQYSAAGGNPQATAAAKHRIINAVLALVAYLFLFVFLQWLTPGGL